MQRWNKITVFQSDLAIAATQAPSICGTCGGNYLEDVSHHLDG